MKYGSVLKSEKNIAKPDIDVLKHHGLIYFGGTPMEPSFFGTGKVWANEDDSDWPVYAIYVRGTNDLVILENKSDSWNEIELRDVSIRQLHNIIFHMCLKIEMYGHLRRQNGLPEV